ncbi:MotA/TolQ/ExbB proton channel family protein [bacterium]|nr:MotA/TolQ/ExbB proton channel family protein [bacterium]
MKDRIFAIAHFADQGVLYLLIALTFASLALIVERYMKLNKLAKQSAEQRQKLEEAMSAVKIANLEDVKLDPTSLEGRVMTYGFEHLKQNGLKGLAETFDTFIKFQQPKLEKSLAFLATVGSNAPYIGLFGTVLGIMKSFHDLANSTNAGQQTVMSGISAALIATAAGLLVAIPNIVAFNYFQKQVKAIIGSVESCKDIMIAYGKMKGH